MSQDSKPTSSAAVKAPEWIEKVRSIAEDVCRSEGCRLYDLEFFGIGKGRTLQIFVDKDGGVGIDDCSNVSKGLNAVLDEGEGVIPGEAYTLEVSTPGIDRHLKLPWHFEKVVGKKISVRARAPFGDYGMELPQWKHAKTVESELAAADSEGLTFHIKGGDLKLPYGAVEKAKVVFEVKQALKKNKK